MVTLFDEVVKKISTLANDPLGQVYQCVWKTEIGEIRWNSGFVQIRRNGEKYFSFGLEDSEFLQSLPASPVERTHSEQV